MRNITDKICDVCGGNAGPILGQKHCRTKECTFGYVMKTVENRTEIRGDCHVWTGRLRKGGVACVSLQHNWPDGKRKDYRVLDLVSNRGEGQSEMSLNRNYKNLCGTEGCVNPDHNQLEAKLNLFIAARLPVEPLAQYIERRGGPVILEKAMAESVRRNRSEGGTISITRIDEICIDGLHCHPAEIYGEEFFTAC